MFWVVCKKKSRAFKSRLHPSLNEQRQIFIISSIRNGKHICNMKSHLWHCSKCGAYFCHLFTAFATIEESAGAKKSLVRFLRMCFSWFWNRYDGTLITHYFEAVINVFQFFFLKKRGHQIAFICFCLSLLLLSSYKLQFERENGTKWCKSSIYFISVIIKKTREKIRQRRKKNWREKKTECT